MKIKKVFCVIGTRPEAIKMAPVVSELKKRGDLQVQVVATSQHREMLKQIFSMFGIVPDFDLDVMEKNQNLETLTSKILIKISELYEAEKPDVVLVQGDTTTVMAATLAAFYKKIPVGHVEAGLRTGDMMNPFPEELNRTLVSKMARWHFAPTEGSKDNLLKENINPSDIYVTGNTVIDALHHVQKKLIASSSTDVHMKSILVTCHRRENFGEPLIRICTALLKIATDFPDMEIIFPVHPNPNVSSVVRERLSHQANINLKDPLDYVDLVRAMSNCHFVITDSGGIQEEAPALGKPVLVLREETERPEAVSFGVARLVGTQAESIYSEAQKLILDKEHYKKMAVGASPYGDGLASQRIVDILCRQ